MAEVVAAVAEVTVATAARVGWEEGAVWGAVGWQGAQARRAQVVMRVALGVEATRVVGMTGWAAEAEEEVQEAAAPAEAATVAPEAVGAMEAAKRVPEK